jgi:ferrochelatase
VSEFPPGIGILLCNLGSPTAPKPSAVRAFLRRFLADPWVIDAPRLRWFAIRNLIVLPLRPRRLSRLYSGIWTADGSPLDITTRRQAHALQDLLEERLEASIAVVVGMRYGRPSLPEGLHTLSQAGCERMLIMPLYPQYSGATTGSTLAVIADEFERWRDPPELRNVFSYHLHNGYIESLAASVRELWQTEGRAQRLLISFHGLPESYAERGDPYPLQCRATAGALASSLGLEGGQWSIAYQSRFGRELWLQPYLDEVLTEWGREGLDSVDVLCPGFAADCLETLEEVAVAGRRSFESAGGGRFRYIEALNDRPDHIGALAEIATENMRGWS